MNSNMDWNQVRVFLAIARTQSLTAAARELGVSQPTVSRQLQALEEVLSVSLLRRHSRGVALTAEGEALRAHAEAVNTQMAAFARAATGVQAQIQGHVRVSATETVGAILLPEVLTRLRRTHQGLQVSLRLDNLAQDLLAGDVDIAVRMFRPKQRDLVGRKVGVARSGLYASLSYLQEKGTPQSLDDLAHHDVIGFDRNTMFLRAFEAASPHLAPGKLAFRTDSMLAQLAALRQGLGVGVVQEVIAAHDPQLLRVCPAVNLPPLEVWVVTHPDLRSAAHVRMVMQELSSFLSDLYTAT